MNAPPPDSAAETPENADSGWVSAMRAGDFKRAAVEFLTAD